jgi:hypothetical protein
VEQSEFVMDLLDEEGVNFAVGAVVEDVLDLNGWESTAL